jgi:hypothetical protein
MALSCTLRRVIAGSWSVLSPLRPGSLLQLSVRRCRRTDLPSWGCAASQCLVDGDASGSFGSPRSPSVLVLTDPTHGAFASPPCHAALSSNVVIHSQAFTLLQGMTRVFPRAARSTVPLMGFHSLQRSPAQRSGISGVPPPLHASSEFEPLVTPCSPSCLPSLSGRVALGILPSGS